MPRPRRRGGVWRTFRTLILETGGRQLEALEDLEQCDVIAAEMLRFRSTGFELVETISRDSTDSESMDQARRALIQFAFAEELLVRIATHLHDGLEQVDAAQTSTLQAMSLLTHWREGS